MQTIIIIILSCLSVFVFVLYLKWRISTTSLVYYIEQKQYAQPTDSELKECTAYVSKNLIKDLFRIGS